MSATPPPLDWQPILVAAGASQRFGSRNKLLQLIDGEPIVIRSLRVLVSLPSPHPPVAVVSSETRDVIAAWAKQEGIAKLQLVPGGERRRDSVEAALRVCTADYVAVHDGARPLATTALLERLLTAAAGEAGAVPAIALVDTIAVVEVRDRLSSQLDRSTLRAVQTPQVVRREDWLRAAALDPTDVTDDAAMLLRLGLKCRLVEGEAANLKVTRPADLDVIRALAGEGTN
ncbi:MAG: 2-C-methyl-D-erythritol 4-phosphate cytidylyltransferase [Dehalococcoidia bacterium]